ncbi:DUF3179 domain-containing protein [Haladaptatus sp. NG-SE-30]
MERRAFLATLATTTVGGLGGCLGGVEHRGDLFGKGESGGDTERPPTAPRIDDLPVPKKELNRGALRDAIPAITEPAFGSDWEGVTVEVTNEFGTYTAHPRLADNDEVIGIERAGQARAYPLRVLNWHEVVNDSLGGPLLVTYCPLCGSGVAAIRAPRGEKTVFGVSGLLWNANLVLYDRTTDSLWSQLAATAIRGPAIGETLELVPSTLTTLKAWRAEHPDTKVLLPPPRSNTVVGREHGMRDYSLDPYGGYRTNEQIGFDGGSFEDDRLHPKTQVLGIVAGGEARAYPLPTVRRTGVVNDRVGGKPVVVASAPGEALVAHYRRVDGTTLRFEADGRKYLRAGGSRWRRTTGRAVDGPHEGTKLDRATDVPPLFWFAWLDAHPKTSVCER